MKLKNALAIGLCLSFINPLMAVKYERNLEDFGFSSEVEKFRRRISQISIKIYLRLVQRFFSNS